MDVKKENVEGVDPWQLHENGVTSFLEPSETIKLDNSFIENAHEYVLKVDRSKEKQNENQLLFWPGYFNARRQLQGYTIHSASKFTPIDSPYAVNQNETPPISPFIIDEKSDIDDEYLLTEKELNQAHANPHLVTFCEVPGRLSLLGTHRKTIVTLAEIKRRISPPESLNQSLMSAMLRKAKNRDGGEQVTKRLRDFGMSLPQGRRKPLSNTLFTSLCEGEAVQLARDFSKLSQHHFPTKSIIYETLSNIKSVKEMSSTQTTYQVTSNVVNDILRILSKDKAPVCDMPIKIKSNLHPESQQEFIQYSLMTHGFGMPAHIAGLSTFASGLQEAQRALMRPADFCKAIQRPVPTAVKSAIFEHFVMSNQSHN